ncbi:hypothetical protein PM082_003606 [Marasmius tenuissimus]|nr:hypothetical protein PM082_003606 [Marasmius tenuissimus]
MGSIFHPPPPPSSTITTPEMANPRTKNITYDDRDTNTLKYRNMWFHETWNASNVGQTGTLSSTSDANATVTFSESLYGPFLGFYTNVLLGFPEPAIAFYYFGMPRQNTDLYGVCIDCDPKQPDFQTIDAVNVTDDGKNPPVALFSKRFDTPAQHVIILRNQIDDTRSRPERRSSHVTIDRFVLEVVDNSSVPVPVIPSPSPSVTSDTVKLGPPIGAIVGGTIGGFLLAIVMIVAGVYYWYRHRRQLVSVHNNLNADDSEASFSTIVPYLVMHPSISKEERPKAGEPDPNSTLRRPPSPTPSSGSTSIVAYFRFRRRGWQREVDNDAERRPERRREADAGPIPAEDEESTLPPLYEQVFRGGPSNCLPSGQEPNGQSQSMSFFVQNAVK